MTSKVTQCAYLSESIRQAQYTRPNEGDEDVCKDLDATVCPFIVHCFHPAPPPRFGSQQKAKMLTQTVNNRSLLDVVSLLKIVTREINSYAIGLH